MFVLSDYLHLTELRRACRERRNVRIPALTRRKSWRRPCSAFSAAAIREIRVYEGNRIEIDYLLPESCRALLEG